jgi:ribose transport system permease protein
VSVSVQERTGEAAAPRGRAPRLSLDGIREALRESTAGPVYVALAGLFALCWLVVALDGGSFVTVDNVVNMLVRSVALGIVSVGQTLVILAGSLDLSVAYLISGATLLFAEVTGGDPDKLTLGILATLALGGVVGAFNGLVITKLRVNAFIATLGTALILKGIIEARYDGPAGSVPENFESTLGYTRFGPIPVSVILLAAVAICAWFLLRHTRFGFRLYAVGGDEEVSKLSGVRTHRTIVAAHVLCSICAVLTGLFIASRLGAGSPLVGTDGGYDLESIAAVVLGGTALMGGRGGVPGTIAGVFMLAVLDNTFNQLEVDAFLKDVVRGVIIVAAVAVHTARRRSRVTGVATG